MFESISKKFARPLAKLISKSGTCFLKAFRLDEVLWKTESKLIFIHRKYLSQAKRHRTTQTNERTFERAKHWERNRARMTQSHVLISRVTNEQASILKLICLSNFNFLHVNNKQIVMKFYFQNKNNYVVHSSINIRNENRFQKKW